MGGFTVSINAIKEPLENTMAKYKESPVTDDEKVIKTLWDEKQKALRCCGTTLTPQSTVGLYMTQLSIQHQKNLSYLSLVVPNSKLPTIEWMIVEKLLKTQTSMSQDALKNLNTNSWITELTSLLLVLCSVLSCSSTCWVHFICAPTLERNEETSVCTKKKPKLKFNSLICISLFSFFYQKYRIQN